MIRTLSKMVHWLEARFPEKLTVTAGDYLEMKAQVAALHGEMSLLRDSLKVAERGIEVAVDRIGAIESSAVHKKAVADVIKVLQDLKTEFASLKVSIGFRGPAQEAELQALLNGEFINGQE